MKIKAKKLTVENFAVYGQFANMFDKKMAGFGTDAFTFYRDSIRYAISEPVIGFSTFCIKRDGDFHIKAMEYHNHASEVLMPMDDDMILCIQKAGNNSEPSEDEIEAFIVPKHVMVSINPGVWHFMPLPVSQSEVNVMVALPERVYCNDLVSVDISAKNITVEI